jgi:alpha-L-rhamnosidase
MTSWIRVPEIVLPEVGSRPVYQLRRVFEVEQVPVSVELKISAHGIYTAFLNGQRVGNDEMTPGYTEYSVRTQFQSYDVTELLTPGRNVLVVELADGWYRGAVGATQVGNQYGDAVELWGELVESVPEERVLVATDPSWRFTPSHILKADLFRGQVEDQRLIDSAIHHADFDDSTWQTAIEVDYAGDLVPQQVQANRVTEYLTPKSIRRLDDNTQIVDFGQNINGWVRLQSLGPVGTTVTLTHAEWLGNDGDVTTAHLDVHFPIFPEPIYAHQVDTVISAGAANGVFEPRYTSHGFQYVRVEGLPFDLKFEDISAAVVHTDLPRIGHLRTSDDRINWIHDAAVWSFRGNALDVPTDCPTRERSGWTGDWQLFAETAAFLYDVREFNRKFLADVRAVQEENGRVLNIAPRDKTSVEGFPGKLNGSSGWGDVVAQAPWIMYRQYGEVDQLEENFEAMTRWVQFAVQTAASGRHPSREAEPKKPHEDYLWDTGFHWGEWLEPDNPVEDFGAFLAADKAIVATAYLHRSALQVAEAARILGKVNVIADYLEIASHALAAWQAEFLRPDGSISQPSQANYARALAFGMIPDELVSQAAGHLAKLVVENEYRLATGFLATPMLLPALADNGYLDLAYKLLFQEQEPSWLAMRNRGATTVWERWNGVDENGTPHDSLNHYSKGAVITFLHQYTAGLKVLEPGYRRFAVKPMPTSGLEWIELTLESPAGLIEVEWRQQNGTFTLELRVPAGAEAEVRLPNGAETTLSGGNHVLECSL